MSDCPPGCQVNLNVSFFFRFPFAFTFPYFSKFYSTKPFFFKFLSIQKITFFREEIGIREADYRITAFASPLRT